MSDIRTRPVTPEYEDSWMRVFTKKAGEACGKSRAKRAALFFTAGEKLECGDAVVLKDNFLYKATVDDIEKL